MSIQLDHTFVSVTSIFNLLCFSAFVSDIWLNLLLGEENITGYSSYDFHSVSLLQFSFLRYSCQLACFISSRALLDHLVQNFVASKVLSQNQFVSQVSSRIAKFQSSTRIRTHMHLSSPILLSMKRIVRVALN